MNRYDKIIEHPSFEKYISKIEKAEKDRIYCKHGITHLLDVARIAYIMNLEEGQPFSKDVIYGMALLHDIGKVKQYKEGIPHEITGAKKAVKILSECDYKEEEIALIEKAILEHRRGPENLSVDQQDGKADGNHVHVCDEQYRLSNLLYQADKKSRICRYCKAKDSCNWSEEQKNSQIPY